ncbi:MAG: lipoprotein-releasing ABC transporter permease subunit [Desulfovibrio sp.]
MRFETFVALRYLCALRKKSFITVISSFAVCGVAMGVAALIIAISVMNGFSTELREKILGVNAHVVISGYSGGIKNYQQLAETVKNQSGVTGVTPFVYSEVMLSAPGGVKGVVLRGINPESIGSVVSLSDDMVVGGLDLLDIKGRPPGIIIGKELANRLGAGIGSNVNLLSSSGRRSAAGFTPKIKPFRVAGVFRTGLFEYDTSLAYVTIPAARKLLGYKGDIVTGLEVSVEDVYTADAVAQDIRDAVGDRSYSVNSWQQMNANLFAALQLEKTAMFIVLLMIILVGSFSIVTSLVMLVMQKRRDIAVMMSLGADVSAIRRIFMIQGSMIGFVGTASGFLIGVPVSLLLKKYQFIKLPSNVYPVDFLPVRIESMDLLLIGVSALVLCFLATIYPAQRAATLNPSEALRYE